MHIAAATLVLPRSSGLSVFLLPFFFISLIPNRRPKGSSRGVPKTGTNVTRSERKYSTKVVGVATNGLICRSFFCLHSHQTFYWLFSRPCSFYLSFQIEIKFFYALPPNSVLLFAPIKVNRKACFFGAQKWFNGRIHWYLWKYIWDTQSSANFGWSYRF